MAYISPPIMIPYNTNGSCDVPIALFDKVSLTLIIVLMITAAILMMVDNNYRRDLSLWVEGCFILSIFVGFVWMIHAIWF